MMMSRLEEATAPPCGRVTLSHGRNKGGQAMLPLLPEPVLSENPCCKSCESEPSESSPVPAGKATRAKRLAKFKRALLAPPGGRCTSNGTRARCAVKPTASRPPARKQGGCGASSARRVVPVSVVEAGHRSHAPFLSARSPIPLRRRIPADGLAHLPSDVLTRLAHGACSDPACLTCRSTGAAERRNRERDPQLATLPLATDSRVASLGSTLSGGVAHEVVAVHNGKSAYLVSFGPTERRWVAYLRRSLGLSNDPTTSRLLVARIADRFALASRPPDAPLSALLASGSGRARSGASFAAAAPPPPPPGPASLGGIDLGSLICHFPTENFWSGIINFDVPRGLSPSDPSWEGLLFMLDPYTSSSNRANWLDWAQLHALLDTSYWDAGYDEGTYPNWKLGWGRNHRFLLHALQIAYSFRHHIPKRWPYIGTPLSALFEAFCVDMPDQLATTFETGSAIIRINTGSDPCPARSDTQLVESIAGSGERTYTFTLKDPADTTVLPFRGAGRCGSWVRVCPSYIQGHALVADKFLYWGNRAYWYSQGPCVETLGELLTYLVMARRCGQVALGAFMVPARTLVHEFAHYLYSCGVSASHCDLDCCPQGLAAWFYARTRAYLGAPEVQADAGVDTDFVDVTHTYSSDCDDYSSSGKAISFDFTFTNPGVAGDESAFTLDGVSYPSSGLCDPTLLMPPFAGFP